MPELPEVETTLNGIAPYLRGQTIAALEVRQRHLRWPVPRGLERNVAGQSIRHLRRRGKYILVELERGGLLIHLGMSGSLRVLPEFTSPGPHDHFDIITSVGPVIRYRDPRRFGSLLWHPKDIDQHPRLGNLGIEPLESGFSGETLYQAAQKRRVAVKNLIMNGQVVVGVGNIYASESLFDAGIHPHRGCHRIAASRYQALAHSIRKILKRAIRQGGTTLRDFSQADGEPGYFEQQLMVYGRQGERCPRCSGEIRKTVTSQRATYYCPGCQH